jgi:hypothetical protein
MEELNLKVKADTSEAVASMRRLEEATKRAHRSSRSGWASTKLHLALITMATITLVFVFVVARTGESAGWGEYCVAMISAAGIYSASRVTESFAQRPSTSTPPQGG